MSGKSESKSKSISIDNIIDFYRKYSAKDKTLKAIQYFLKTGLYYNWFDAAQRSPELKKIFLALVLHRKVFRIFEEVRELRTLQRLAMTFLKSIGPKSTDDSQTILIKGLKSLKSALMLGYWLCDHMVWLASIGGVKANRQYWVQMSFDLWLGANVCNLIVALNENSKGDLSTTAKVKTVKSIFDVAVAGGFAKRLTSINHGQIGMAGLASALMHLWLMY